MFNPESIKFERPKSFSQNIERQERYLEIIKKKAEPYTPKEDDFTDLYPQAEINADLALVAERKKQFAENETERGVLFKRISDVFEGVVVEQAEQNGWFGESVTFYPTSSYDDIVNGVDGVAEFYTFEEDTEGNEQRSPLQSAMSFDVVFSADAERITKKLERTSKMIREGKLTEVKYFEDEHGNKKSIKAPRIVLGSRLSSAEKLIDLWGSKSADKNKQLAEHPMQIKLLLESYIQLRHFAEYAKEHKQMDIAYSYAELSNIIAEIIQSKNELYKQHYNEISDDIVFTTIREYCNQSEF